MKARRGVVHQRASRIQRVSKDQAALAKEMGDLQEQFNTVKGDVTPAKLQAIITSLHAAAFERMENLIRQTTVMLEVQLQAWKEGRFPTLEEIEKAIARVATLERPLPVDFSGDRALVPEAEESA